MSPAEVFERLIEPAGCLRQLSGAQEAARGEVGMLQALGKVAENYVPRDVFGIEERDAFVTRQRIDIALVLKKELRRRAELLDGLGGPVLLLQQNAIAHQSVGGLRKRSKEAGEDRRGLGDVARLDVPVELRAVILGGERRLVEASVDVGQRLQGFLVGRSLFEDGLVFGDRLAELVLFEAAPSLIEMLVEVRSHAKFHVLRAVRGRKNPLVSRTPPRIARR